MASGFSGGGPDLYAGISGRSIANMNSANNPSQSSYRRQLSQMFADSYPSYHHQITQHRTATPSLTPPAGLIGKRTLAEIQAYQQQQPNLNPLLNGLLLRSVKPRMYQHTSPISTLSPIEFSANMSPELPALSQRYGAPVLQQLRPQPMNLGAGPATHSTSQTLPCIPYQNAVQNQNRQESSEKMMNRLQELEKQLLEDNDEEEEGDAVSVITNTNSEWSETIQNLISCSSPKPIAPSPTSSSSSSSTSVTTPVPTCSKQTVLEAAYAISEGKSNLAAEILTRISQASDSRGTSEQRLMEYMLIALKSRVNSAENPPPVAELYSKEHFGSTQLLYELCPCFKLGFVTANLAIVEATLSQHPNSCNGFHVVDFDIGHGGQYMNLLHLLSERRTGKPPIKVKITAVSDDGADEKERLRIVGDKLSQLAERVGVSLHFNAVCCKLSDLSRDSLGCEADEPLAVNFAFKLYTMPDESVSIENPRDELLRRVKKLAPRVVTLVEREMNTNTAPFAARVKEVGAYYGALFECIESTVQQKDGGERVKVQEALGRQLANSVACEGRDRLERCEVFGKWRARMSMAGFESKPLSPRIAESMTDRLSSSNRVSPGFAVKQENGGVCFGWMGKTLTVASAWR